MKRTGSLSGRVAGSRLRRSALRLTRWLPALLFSVHSCAQQPASQAAAGVERSTVRADGTVLLEGRPFYPVGYYHYSFADTPTQRLKDLEMIGRSGFNVMFPVVISEEDYGNLEGFYDAAADAGVKLLFDRLPEPYHQTLMPRLASKPAHLAWQIADDAQRFSRSELLEWHKAAKLIDPAHATYASMGISPSLPHTSLYGTAQLVGNQSYPVGYYPLHSVYPSMKLHVQQAESRGAAPIANLQTFAWPGKRWPTPAEVTNMTWQSVAAGVKGVLFYTFMSLKLTDIRDNPELYATTERLAREILEVSPLLMDGRRTYLKTDATTFVTMWEHPRGRLLVAVNAGPGEWTGALRPPGGARSVAPAFQYPRSFSVRGEELLGQLAAGEVAVLWIH